MFVILRTRKSLRWLLPISLLVMSLVLVGCTGGGSDRDGTGVTLDFGSQGYPEVEILGEMVKALIEEKTDHKVNHIKNLGSSLAAHEATIRGDIDMSTNFTGTLFLGTFDQTLTDEYRDPAKVFDYVKDAMLEEFNLHVVANYGYNNTYAISVPRAWAEQHNITKQSELEPYAKDMILAVRSSWKTYPGQGYPEYTELYGFEFKETPEMEFGIMYQAIAAGNVDAICAYSTDGQLVAQDLLVLEDDKGFNPPYNGILVVNGDIMEAHPELEAVFAVLDQLVDTEQMQELNKLVAVDELEPVDVARNFLRDKGLIE